MSTSDILGATGPVLFILGLWGTFSLAHLVRKVVSFNVMGSGAFLVLAAVATESGNRTPDPVPHAMVLTGIVVAMASSAFALALARQIAHRTGCWLLPEDREET